MLFCNLVLFAVEKITNMTFKVFKEAVVMNVSTTAKPQEALILSSESYLIQSNRV